MLSERSRRFKEEAEPVLLDRLRFFWESTLSERDRFESTLSDRDRFESVLSDLDLFLLLFLEELESWLSDRDRAGLFRSSFVASAALLGWSWLFFFVSSELLALSRFLVSADGAALAKAGATAAAVDDDGGNKWAQHGAAILMGRRSLQGMCRYSTSSSSSSSSSLSAPKTIVDVWDRFQTEIESRTWSQLGSSTFRMQWYSAASRVWNSDEEDRPHGA